MKTKSKQLEGMQDAEKWSHRRAIARDELPGTPFDRLFIANRLNRSGLSNPQATKVSMALLGEEVSQRIADGDAPWFRRLAKALDAWSDHVPAPDSLRHDILGFCIPPTATFKVREILAYLRGENERKPQVVHKETANTERIVRRICTELGIKLTGKRGRPRKSDTK